MLAKQVHGTRLALAPVTPRVAAVAVATTSAALSGTGSGKTARSSSGGGGGDGGGREMATVAAATAATVPLDTLRAVQPAKRRRTVANKQRAPLRTAAATTAVDVANGNTVQLTRLDYCTLQRFIEANE